LYESSLSRFRPIILTTMTTVAGLGPLLLEKSFQAQFLIPMAASVAFGLVLVTTLTLFMLPSMLLLINRIKGWAVAQWEGYHPDPRLLEPSREGRISYLWLWIFFGLLSVVAFLGIVMLTLKLTQFLIH
jgi:hypothetical protein